MSNDQIESAIARRTEEKSKLKDGTIQQAMRDRMDADASFSALVGAAWTAVETAVHERAVEAEPKRKNFEVHHEMEVSKDAFLICLHETGDIEQAREVGISRTAPPADQVEAEIEEDCPAP